MVKLCVKTFPLCKWQTVVLSSVPRAFAFPVARSPLKGRTWLLLSSSSSWLLFLQTTAGKGKRRGGGGGGKTFLFLFPRRDELRDIEFMCSHSLPRLGVRVCETRRRLLLFSHSNATRASRSLTHSLVAWRLMHTAISGWHSHSLLLSLSPSCLCVSPLFAGCRCRCCNRRPSIAATVTVTAAAAAPFPSLACE